MVGMAGFNWDVDGEERFIQFSLIRNAEWTEERELMNFEVGDDIPYVSVGLGDLDIEENEYDRELWNMLLQVTNLDAT